MKKKILSLLVSMLLLVLITACGSESSDESSTNDNSGDGANSESDGDTVTIEYWELSDRKGQLEPIIEDFEAKNPNINVEMSTKAVDAHKDGLKVAASSGTMPTIWFNWGGSLGDFYTKNGLTLDLTEYAEENNWDENFKESALQLATFDGQLSGVPISLNGLGIFYRKDIFDDLGLEEPTKFSEFEEVMAEIKANNITPVSVGGKFGWHTMRFTEAVLEHYAGSELKDQLTSLETSWDQPEVKQTYDKLKEWEQNGYFPEGFITLDPNEAKMPFYSGDAAMTIEGLWFDTTMIEDDFDLSTIGFFPMPTDQEPLRISSFAEMLQINSEATEEQQEAAIKFALYVMSDEVMENHSEIVKYPSPRKGVEAPKEIIHANEMNEALESGNFIITDQALPQEIITKFFEAQDKVITGELTTEEAVELMDTSVEEYKAE